MIRKVLIYVSIISISASAFIALPHIISREDISAVLSFMEQNQKIRILIVPGHEPDAGGAEYKKLKERDLNLQLSNILKDYLEGNERLEVILARDDFGWNKDIENFVTTNENKIMEWVADMKHKMLTAIGEGKIELIDPDMKHNAAASNAVLFLYGTNKWIAENDIDIALHIHFNNNPKINGRPNYKGYCMYVPEKQYGNSASSKIFADYLYEEIDKIQNKSNMPQEKDTMIEDQELIATGNYNTLKIPSVVVEYAYIYEPVMQSSSTRNTFIIKAASSTATAINKYIEEQF